MCFVGWDAICLDLDIAVHADTFAKSQEALNSALETYVEDVCKEPNPKDRKRLLSRKAPFHVRFKWGLGLFLHQVQNGHNRRKQSCTASFDLMCPA